MIASSDWRTAAATVANESLCMLMCVDRGKGGGLELWLRTDEGTVLSCAVDGGAQSLAAIWPDALVREREIHEMFGVRFDNPASHEPLVFQADHSLYGVHPLLKSRILKERNVVAWPGAKDPSDSSTSPSRRKTLPVGVVDASNFEGKLI